MGCPDAVCAQYGRPAGVILSLHVCRYSIEPALSNRARNLFPKDNERAELCDETEEHGPKVTVVFVSKLLSGGAKRLARA
jgi:hypothetical protein